jgi:hypothetical protein
MPINPGLLHPSALSAGREVGIYRPPKYFLAEGVGFEPTELSLNGFQDRRLKPLGHPSGLYVFLRNFRIRSCIELGPMACGVLLAETKKLFAIIMHSVRF